MALLKRPASRIRMWADLSALLIQQGYLVKPVEVGSSMLVIRGAPLGDYWMIGDNGGELTVHRLNTGPHLSVPYHHMQYGGQMDGGTMFYRVQQAMRGDPIDYDVRLPELCEAMRRAA